ncbi:hypothetical protein QA597_06465 [Marinilabiliaceae bacterium ANBcel2]|nr:hypothetical protein [Marinilabiliaceae bacterium ANBcel2]
MLKFILLHNLCSYKLLRATLLITVSLAISSCASFYTRTQAVQNEIAKGNFEKADEQLAKNKKWKEGNHRVLWYMNRGVVSFMLGHHQESINYFNKADYYIEDYSKSVGSEALVLVSNPMARPYKPEDFEAIMVHYYKALNFIAMGNFEGALIECRRVNIKLQEFNEQYNEKKNRYARDAFAHNLIGIIYQAAGDFNNAFIAYRNALEIYQNDYTNLFGVEAPLQLKKDLLYSAYRTGFHDEVNKYEEEFGITVPDIDEKKGDVVLLWMNGLGPVKSEWSINLTNAGTRDNYLIFHNEEMGFTFPLYIGNRSRQERSSFSDLSVLRVAFPKYVARNPIYFNAKIIANEKEKPLEKAQDINQIAFQTLEDRMLREIGNNLLRLVTKQTMERAAQSQNEYLGTIVSLFNAFTEKADTRNWQSLPHSLYYTRIHLPEGAHQVDLIQQGARGESREKIDVDIKRGKTTFKVHHQLEVQSR